jgi:hypothetical protein
VKSLVQRQRAIRLEESNERNPPPRLVPVEPTVHVTIGRIEVRATRSEDTKRPEHGGSPVMSLDEYLRKRQKRAGE